jgi:MFS family permease
MLRRAARKTFLSLRNRNFRLYFTGQLVSNTGNWLTSVALTLLVLEITGRGLAVGVLAACQYGPILFLSPWAGAIADRGDKRRLLLLTQGLEMAQSIGLAILAFLPRTPIAGLYVLALAGGILLAFDNPLRRSFVSEMVPAEDTPNAVVLYSTTVNVARVFGPALAGLLVVTLGYGWCFAIDAASYVAVLVCLVMMRPAELHREPRGPRSRGEVRAGLRYLAAVPDLWISFAVLAAIGTLAYNFNVTLPLFVTGALHSTGSVFTILYAVFSCGAVACALVVARRGLVRIRHMLIGALALGVTMLLLAAAPGVRTAAVAVFFVGMASILYMTSTTAIVQVVAKREMHGRLLALQTVLVAGTAVIGGPLLGWLADAMGPRAPIVLGGIVCLLAALAGTFANSTLGTPGGSRGRESTDRRQPPMLPAAECGSPSIATPPMACLDAGRRKILARQHHSADNQAKRSRRCSYSKMKAGTASWNTPESPHRREDSSIVHPSNGAPQ